MSPLAMVRMAWNLLFGSEVLGSHPRAEDRSEVRQYGLDPHLEEGLFQSNQDFDHSRVPVVPRGPHMEMAGGVGFTPDDTVKISRE